MREIHIHIPAGLPDDQEIHVHLDGPADEAVAEAAGSGEPGQLSTQVEAMLRRLEASPSASPHLRGTVAALEAMGYRTGLPRMGNATGQLEKYIRVIDPAAPVRTTAIMRPAYLIFARKHQDALAGMPGAVDGRDSGEIKFPINGQQELGAARKVRR